MKYRLRTLLVLLAVLPPLLWLGWIKYEAWRAEQDLRVRREWIDQYGVQPPVSVLRELR